MVKKLTKLPHLLAALFLAASVAVPAMAQKKRVALQAFWWDFRNSNYPSGWANYLADMAPRLREAGIDAVWVPVNQKNANPMSNGYSPFDHYDLGDKFQKGRVTTPFGDKDEFLRMVAVLHANGIEVIQDIVLNHVDGAGSASGAGGQDSAAIRFYRDNRTLSNYNDIPNDPTNGFKQFRYSSFSTPGLEETAANYWARNGRWPKNWQNFNPGPGDNRFTGSDLTRIQFGPDIAFYPNAIGLATNATFNPVQAPNYMRDQSRAWMIWLKKQTGVDGWRLDAIKHFPTSVQEDILWNTMFNAGFANGGNDMWSVGEWVGGRNETDAWVDAVQGRAGAFDFNLRGFPNSPGLYGMVYGLGNYDLSNLPATQAFRRDRTVNFVNNHDTFRPTQPSSGSRGLNAVGDYPVDAQGNPVGWQSGSELSPNIDPREPRLAAAYAVTLGMDGSPCFFFEDLFDIGTRGVRYTHLPKDTSTLRFRDDIRFLSRAHQIFRLKDGAYFVPHASADHLILERGGRAIIGVNDSWANWQGTWITTQFAPGTRLIDYGGSSGPNDVRVVQADRRVQISTPPCNGTARRRGFSFWAPEGTNFDAPINIPAIPTTQEWELANDLGDSHPRSLQQGGEIPARSRATRTAGKIFAASGSLITYRLFPSFNTHSLTLLLTDACGTVIDSIAGTGNLIKTYNAPRTGWYTLRARNTSDTNSIGQRAWVNVTYSAPREIDARANPSFIPPSAQVGPNRFLCSNNRTINAFIDNNFTYTWLDSANNVLSNGATYQVPRGGLYRLRVRSNISGCVAEDSVRILGIQQLVLPQVSRAGDTLTAIPTGLPGVTWQWNRNGAPIQGATDSVFIALQPGNYTVTIRTNAGCTINSAAVVVTSLEKVLKDAAIAIYPNPTANFFAIALPEGQHANYILRNMEGKVVSTGLIEQEGIVSVEKLGTGIYLLQITNGKESVTKKVSVVR